jgi:hypothetical protein
MNFSISLRFACGVLLTGALASCLATPTDTDVDGLVESPPLETQGGVCKSCSNGVCEAGTWVGRTCCTGCVDAYGCNAGTTKTFCGHGGEACQTCTDFGPCMPGACTADGVCGVAFLPAGSPCGDGGTCNTLEQCL